MKIFCPIPLKPCPFCKEKEDMCPQYYIGQYHIQCTCGASGPPSDDVDKCFELWNTRPDPDNPDCKSSWHDYLKERGFDICKDCGKPLENFGG